MHADEPTSSLDDENTELLTNLLSKINKKKVTIVLARARNVISRESEFGL